MRKYIGLSVLSLSVITLFSFMLYSNSEANLASKEFDLYQFMEDEVYTEIGVLTGYNPKKSFSRCPSGLSHESSEKSTDAVAYGTIYNAEGCHMEPFCDYKIIIAERKTFLKKTPNEPFIAMADFVKKEQHKQEAARF
jgi:hypothetical protein